MNLEFEAGQGSSFTFLKKVQSGSGAHTAFYSMGAGVVLCDVDHSPPCSAEGENE
jgi:hypothetical protein